MTDHRSDAEACGEDPPEKEDVHGGPGDRAAGNRWVTFGDEKVTEASNEPSSDRYRIRVRGHLGQTMRSAFPGLHAQTSGADTALIGPLPDSAALHGVLAEIEALGLVLLEVHRLPPT
jgi:hypothetical protein